jgi:hypothetical protein
MICDRADQIDFSTYRRLEIIDTDIYIVEAKRGSSQNVVRAEKDDRSQTVRMTEWLLRLLVDWMITTDIRKIH